jgi:hypothetical protein
MNARIKITLLLLLIISLFQTDAFAGNGQANLTGNWNNPSSWLFNGSPGVPGCGDTVTIPAGFIITVNSQESYTGCATPLHIIVGGTLQFTNGNKLDLPCGSEVRVLTGGLIQKATAGGGNSTYINICGGQTEWNAGDGPLSGPVVLGGGGLPVVLIDFNAKYSSGKVFLDWITATEINNDHFFIQRSSDNYNYENIDRIAGNGTSSQTHYYNSIDYKPLIGINYYRLCQVDYDGTTKYSDARAIRTNGKYDVVIYPNPSTGSNLSVLFTGDKDENYNLEICDISGKIVVHKDQLILESGANRIGLSNDLLLSNGTFFVTVSIGDEIYRQRMVICN